MLQLENPIDIAHEDDRDLLARDRLIRVECRVGRAGNYAGLIGPENRLLRPVVEDIIKRHRT